MVKISDFKVGQTAYILSYKDSYLNQQITDTEDLYKRIQNTTIEKVGRKYITADNRKFDVTNNYLESAVYSNLMYRDPVERLFPTLEQVHEFLRAELLFKKLLKEFHYSYTNNGKFTAKQLKDALIALGLVIS